MSAIPKTEGYTDYLDHVKCYKWFCKNKPVYRKLVIDFPCIPHYKPVCEKHKH
jgi:hypothetical protein